MKRLRITPLNIASAVLVTWLLSRFMQDSAEWSTAGWFLLLLLMLVAADQIFRLTLRNLKRVWMAESIFLVFVVISIWILKVW
jgi:hypothetical protein